MLGLTALLAALAASSGVVGVQEAAALGFKKVRVVLMLCVVVDDAAAACAVHNWWASEW